MIKLKAISGMHIVRVEDILHISPIDDTRRKNKSSITLRNVDISLYSTETQEEIFKKIKDI